MQRPQPGFPYTPLGILVAAAVAGWFAAGGPLPPPFDGLRETLPSLQGPLEQAGMWPVLPSWAPFAAGGLSLFLVVLSVLALLRWWREPPEVAPGIFREGHRRYVARGEAVLSERLEGDLRVPAGARLRLTGILSGDLSVESGGTVEGDGRVTGRRSDASPSVPTGRPA